MLLKASSPTVKYGPGELHRVTAIVDGHRFVLCQINPSDWKDLNHETTGMPSYFLNDLARCRLSFWPRPDRDYEVKVTWAEMHED